MSAGAGHRRRHRIQRGLPELQNCHQGCRVYDPEHAHSPFSLILFIAHSFSDVRSLPCADGFAYPVIMAFQNISLFPLDLAAFVLIISCLFFGSSHLNFQISAHDISQ